MNPNPSDRQSSLSASLIIPAAFTIRAVAESAQIYISGYCAVVPSVASAIFTYLASVGGTTIRREFEQVGVVQHLSLEIRLPTLSTLEVMQETIRSAGGTIDTLRIDYHIGLPSQLSAERSSSNALRPQYSLPEQPNPCRGCCYYHGGNYGGHFLVCAVHPGGPVSDKCMDWKPNSNLSQG